MYVCTLIKRTTIHVHPAKSSCQMKTRWISHRAYRVIRSCGYIAPSTTLCVGLRHTFLCEIVLFYYIQAPHQIWTIISYTHYIHIICVYYMWLWCSALNFRMRTEGLWHIGIKVSSRFKKKFKSCYAMFLKETMSNWNFN